jgi:hypothetical protein
VKTDDQLRVFFERLGDLCQRARIAFDRLERLVGDSSACKTPEVWESVDSLVSEAGKISRFFFPGRPGKHTNRADVTVRGVKLRKEFAVQEDSILRSRAVRDHLEHFDERLHGPDPETNLVIMGNVGPRDSVSVPSAVWLDHFDQNSLIVSFGIDTLDIRKLVEEVQRVQARARTILGVDDRMRHSESEGP